MSKAEGVKSAIEGASSLYQFAKNIGADITIDGKAMVVAVRNWTKYKFDFDFEVTRGLYQGASGYILHPYSEKYHGEHHEVKVKGKTNSGCSIVIKLHGDGGVGTYYMRASAARDGLNYVRFHANDRDGLDKVKKHRSGKGYYKAHYEKIDFVINISEDKPAICTVEIVPHGETAPRS